MTLELFIWAEASSLGVFIVDLIVPLTSVGRICYLKPPSNPVRCAAMATTAKCDSLMPGFKRCVDLCNDAEGKRGDFVPFSVEGKTIGYMLPSFTAQLADFGDVFKVIFFCPAMDMHVPLLCSA